jgi:hypothetical protein
MLRFRGACWCYSSSGFLSFITRSVGLPLAPELLELLELPVVKGHPAAESNFSCNDTVSFGAHLGQ